MTMTKTKLKSRPFKKIYCDRPETFLLPPMAFKIWMYHYVREGPDRKSWPAVKTVMTACGIASNRIFYERRRYLVENGWLEKVGEVPSKKKGGRPVPIFKVTRGTIPSKGHKVNLTKGAKSEQNLPELSTQSEFNLGAKSEPNLGAKSGSRSRFTEVHPTEVDSKPLKPEVDGGLGSDLSKEKRNSPDQNLSDSAIKPAPRKPDNPAVIAAKAKLYGRSAR
jgi:hypothetical protein